jgi:DNA-binding transcriptional regulator YiaG
MDYEKKKREKITENEYYKNREIEQIRKQYKISVLYKNK